MYPITQLPNGVRVITSPMPSMNSVTVGVWIGVGGRYESSRLCGISHFIEHLLFKGTRRRTARQISEKVEGIGGYLNAFTGEENTCYYAKASHEHFETLLDVLADMYQNPKFVRSDIDKERQVIKEELLMYRDQPDHHVHELLSETMWPSHPLGRALTGTAASLDGMQRATLLDFKANTYIPASTVVAVAGRCQHKDIVQRVARLLRVKGEGRATPFEPVHEIQQTVQLRFMSKAVEQTHLVVGIRSYARHDRRRYALKMMSVILGENMSSRLFQVIREEHGLAYSIQCATSFFDDTGAFIISAGLDTKRLHKALQLILQELNKIAKRPPSVVELRRAKDYAIGQMRLGLESTSNQMMWCGEHLLSYGVVQTPKEIEKKLEAVTPEEIQAVAKDLFRNERLNAAVITPSKDERTVAKLLTFS